jgi:hypothetical protein
MILKISSLTVKNHVQKILRNLDVLDPTQAVGKALALRILNARSGGGTLAPFDYGRRRRRPKRHHLGPIIW